MVEVLYFDGCPGFEAVMVDLPDVAAQFGAEVSLRSIETIEEAHVRRFLGSPTIRVNGNDVDPGAVGRKDYGMKCRIYRSEGHQLHAPPMRWIVSALRTANHQQR
jgi:hypothetical protein